MNNENDTNDKAHRTELSRCLGSFKKDYYTREREVEILSWPQIYFALGELNNRANRLEDLSHIHVALDNLQDQFNNLKPSTNREG